MCVGGCLPLQLENQWTTCTCTSSRWVSSTIKLLLLSLLLHTHCGLTNRRRRHLLERLFIYLHNSASLLTECRSVLILAFILNKYLWHCIMYNISKPQGLHAKIIRITRIGLECLQINYYTICTNGQCKWYCMM